MPIILSGPLAGEELLELDPVSEDAANAVLQLGPGTSYPIAAHSYPAPPLNVQYASSVDTEGETPVSGRHGNREIQIATEFVDAGGALLAALQAKFAKLQREGGTLRRTMRNGDVRIYDIVAADGWNPVFDLKYELAHLTEVTMTLPARPYARGAEVDLGDNTTTTLPCLIFSETGVTGDVRALGRLLVDNDDSANDQWWVVWGIEQNRHYAFTDSTGSGALFYEAESRTALGGSAIAAGPSGASGSGSNVMRNTGLSLSYQAILSTQATAGGAHLSHVGEFRVFARVQVPTTAAGTVSVALEWGDGDFRRFTQNATAVLDPVWEGTWRIVDLGLVTLTKAIAGTQRWEGRILAKSTVLADDIDVDWLMLVPSGEAYGEVAAVARVAAPTAVTARDEFDQAAGVLAGKTLPVGGGTWSGAGDADDFSIVTGGVARRGGTASDTTARLERAGTGTLTNTVVHVDVKAAAVILGSFYQTRYFGVLARYVDASNFVQANLRFADTGPLVVDVRKKIGGSFIPLEAVTVVPNTSLAQAAAGGWDGSMSIRLAVDESGHFTAWYSISGGPLRVAATGVDSALATGGTLASGGYGLFDENAGIAGLAVDYDNFAVWAGARDAAVFGSQSLEVRHDRVVREDSGGTLWVPPSSTGDYLTVPPAGAEGRTVRTVVKASRSVPGAGADAGIDDISARLFITPRFL